MSGAVFRFRIHRKIIDKGLWVKYNFSSEGVYAELIANSNDALNGFIWGVPAMISIIGWGLYGAQPDCGIPADPRGAEADQGTF